MFEKKCEKCGAPATVLMNVTRFLCSQHAFDLIMAAHGDEARKLRLKSAK